MKQNGPAPSLSTNRNGPTLCSVENVHKSFEWFSILFETNGKVTSNVNIAERLYLESQLGSTQIDGPLQLGKSRNLLLSSGEVLTESLIR